jgi:hypothetical protein
MGGLSHLTVKEPFAIYSLWWLSVAAIKDLFAGEVIGRRFDARMTTDTSTNSGQRVAGGEDPEGARSPHAQLSAVHSSLRISLTRHQFVIPAEEN